MKTIRKLGIVLTLTCILMVSTGMAVVQAKETRAVSIYLSSAALSISNDGTANIIVSLLEGK